MIRIFLLSIVLLVCFPALAQPTLSTKNKKAIELYTQADNCRVRGQYNEAIDLLNMALEKDKNFFEAYYRMGLVNIGKRNYPEAIKNFEKGLSLVKEPGKQKIFWYDLGDTYFGIGDYNKAFDLFTNFLKYEMLNGQKIEHAKQMLRNIEFALQNASVASKYKLKPLSDTVNAYPMQYFPVLTADQQQLIFTRRLGSDMNINSSDEDIVVSKKNVKGQWTKPVSLSGKINTTTMNEGTCTISADGRTLIFTSCAGRQVYGSCDLFVSHKIGDDWSAPENLGPDVNTNAWESQPSLSADGRTLYFVSDRRGGSLGRRDIWVSFQNEKGEWTRAKNMGKPVNSIYDEISPFIHVNNKTLYYASNGLTGYGGYDLFYSEKDSVDNWAKPVNIGAPVNNHEDQFSLFITADGKKGYYSHEQTEPSGLSSSKIYEMEIPEESQIKFRSNYVKGIIRDKQTKQVLSANVELINIEKDETESFVTSDSISGEYLIILTQGAEYALYVNKKGYMFQSKNFNYSEIKDFKPITLDVELDKIQGGSKAILNNVFFDFDKYDLKEKSKTELEHIINFLNDNLQVKIIIGGHTDNMGSSAYNKQLSEKRAAAVYAYLVDNNVKAERLQFKGYGSDQPIATNNSEEGRQLNRRIEFTIR